MAGYKRILLKLSGEALAGAATFGIDADRVRALGREVADVAAGGVQVGVVVGGGNIFRGVAAAARSMDRVTGDHMGMLATVINSLALSDALEQMATVSELGRDAHHGARVGVRAAAGNLGAGVDEQPVGYGRQHSDRKSVV